MAYIFSIEGNIAAGKTTLLKKLKENGLNPFTQYPVDKYKLDFAFIQGEKKLNVEIDGEEYHRNWSGERLRRDIIRNHRLIEDGWTDEECSNCNYNEIVMTKDKVALLIDFKDGNSSNTTMSNIRLLCPNCYLSFNGHFPSSGVFYK